MILELLIKPVTASKKLCNQISQSLLIILSLGIPILIGAIPAFVARQAINSLLAPLNTLQNAFGEMGKDTISPITNQISSKVSNTIFANIFPVTFLIAVAVFTAIYVYYSVKKISVSSKLIWKSMMVSSIQIVYYLLIGALLSSISIKLFLIFILGIINSIICIHSVLEEVELKHEYGYTNSSVPVHNSYETEILEQSKTEAAATFAPVQAPQTSADSPRGFNNREAFNSQYSTQNRSAIQGESLSEKIKNLNKKQKLSLISGAFILVIIIAVFSIGRVLTSKEYVAKKLSQAIVNNDAKEMSKYISSSDSRLQIDEESINAYLNYLKDNSSYTSKILDSINSQAKQTAAITSTNDFNNPITLTTKGKKFLFFNNYVYQLPSYFIKITTDYKGTEVFINNKSTYTSDKDDFIKECGPFLPGKYTVKAKLKTDYAETNGTEEVALTPQQIQGNTLELRLALSGSVPSIYTDYKDAKILVNGKDTGLTVKDDEKLIPLPKDGSCKIQLENEFPWGTLKSNEVAFGKDSLDFYFGKNNTTLLDSIKSTLVEYTKGYINAYTSLDSTKITAVSENYKKGIEQDINYAKESNKPATGNITSVIVNPELSLQNYETNNENTYSVSCQVQFKGDFSTDGTSFFKDNGYSITLLYNSEEKKWLVDQFSTQYSTTPISNGVEIQVK